MQSNLSINSYRPSFGIRVNEKFVKAAHNYYNGIEYRPWRSKLVDKRVQYVMDNLGYDEFELYHETVKIKGKKTLYRLYAKRDDMKPVLISEKDQFRKLIEKLRYLKKHELYEKIKKAKAEQGITYNSQ